MISGDMLLFMFFGVLVGFLLGYLLAFFSLKEECLGNLRIDRSDPDGPYIFLEMESKKGIEHIAKLESVSFKVVDENYTRK